MMPNFAMLLMSAVSLIREVAEGPRITPIAMYATIRGCLVYKARVATTAADEKIRKKENISGSVSMKPIVSLFYILAFIER
jgi:hypothetical protein